MVSVLESSYIVYQLQPYFQISTNVYKSSKLYFYDTGLLCYLLKLNEAESVKLEFFKKGVCLKIML